MNPPRQLASPALTETLPKSNIGNIFIILL